MTGETSEESFLDQREAGHPSRPAGSDVVFGAPEMKQDAMSAGMRRGRPHGFVRTPCIANLIALGAFLMLGAPGCVKRADLTPAASARELHPEGAISEVDGVEMIVETEPWPGREDVTLFVTPVRVTVRNESGDDLRLTYSDFALLAPDGRRYAALPPYGLEGPVEAPTLVGPYVPLHDLRFEHHGFLVASYYSPIYPSLGVYPGLYLHDPFYYRHYHAYWTHHRLPTADMLAWAFPAGVLQDDGMISGYLYFERVDPQEPWVRFRADLVTSKDGRRLGEIRIPFNVDERP